MSDHRPRRRILRLGLSVCAFASLIVIPVRAQDDAVPRTRTFSGLVSPAFPYAQPREVGLSDKELSWLGDEIAEWIGTGELVGAELLIIKAGKAILHEAYGWSNREDLEPMRRNSIFAIQSMSKPFTATAVLMLVEEGLLSLDDPVSSYVPGFAHDSITIHHLLTHTSGFTHDGDWYDYRSPEASLQELVEEWPHKAPENALGVYDYADFNYAHLAYIVGKASGIPIEDYIEERILRPLNLADTSTGFSTALEWRARLNSWYRWNDRAQEFDLRRSSDLAWWTFYPGGWGMFSTAMDYAEFMAMWMDRGARGGPRLLRDGMVEMALRPQAESTEATGYGYGWEVDREMDDGSFWHGGGGGTLATALPRDDMIVIYLTQSRWGNHRAAFVNRLYMSGLIEHPGLGLGFDNMVWVAERPVREMVLPEAERASRVGTYTVVEPEEGGIQVVRVWEEGGLLHLRMGRSGSQADSRFHLVPLANRHFALGRYQDGRLKGVDPNHEIRFETRQGAPTALQVVEDGRVKVTAHRNE